MPARAGLSVATDEQIAAVHRESHALWGAGLDRAGYDAMWAELRATPWGARHLTHHVLLDGEGQVLSSAKVYRPLVRAAGREGRCSAVGALFTPRRHRRRGHARALLESLAGLARERGDACMLLFSDIGTEYYEGLRYMPVPADEATGTLRHAGRRPGGLALRPMTPADLDDVAPCHLAACAGRHVALLRDREHWEFLMARARAFFHRLDASDLARRYRVVTRDGRFAGYLISAEGDGEWNLREAAAADGDGGTLRDILAAGAADAREHGMTGVYGWLPRETAGLVPEWKLRFEPRRRAIPMVLPLGDAPLDAASCFFPYLDQF